MRKNIVVPVLLVVALATFTMWLSSTEASSAPDIVVTVTGDSAPDGCGVNGCTLREAVTEGNSQAGVQVIEIDSDMTVTLTLGQLTVTGDLTVQGAGESSVVTSTGSRIFDVSASGELSLEGLRIKGATVADGCGGGVYSAGDIVMTDVKLDTNTISGKGAGLCSEGMAELTRVTATDNAAAGGPGGAIYNNGTMTVDASVLEENTVTGQVSGGDGGGIANDELGDLTINGTIITENTGTSVACDDCSSGAGISNEGMLKVTASTISYNHADNSAAISSSGSATIERSTISHNDAGSITVARDSTLSIYASTISGNLAAGYPKQGFGGIQTFGSTTIIASTIANNTSDWVQYGGIFNANTGVTSLQAVILANNGTKNCHTGGTIASSGKNVADDDTCNPSGTDQVVADAKIGPLANNGGFTQTHALISGSPAIDTGQGYFCTTDQRFAPRPVGAQCDVGSFEFGGSPPTPTAAPTPTPAPIAYPLGDTSCNDRIDVADITAELELAAGLAEPDDCGRTTIPCIQVDSDCFPWWTDTDCNQQIDVKDALWIVLHLAGAPENIIECLPVGSYPVG